MRNNLSISASVSIVEMVAHITLVIWVIFPALKNSQTELAIFYGVSYFFFAIAQFFCAAYFDSKIWFKPESLPFQLLIDAFLSAATLVIPLAAAGLAHLIKNGLQSDMTSAQQAGKVQTDGSDLIATLQSDMQPVIEYTQTASDTIHNAFIQAPVALFGTNLIVFAIAFHLVTRVLGVSLYAWAQKN